MVFVSDALMLISEGMGKKERFHDIVIICKVACFSVERIIVSMMLAI